MPINCLPSSICHFLRLTGKLLPTHPACLWPEETFIIYMLIAVINSLQRHLPAVSGHFPSFFLLFFFLASDLNKSLNTSLCHQVEKGVAQSNAYSMDHLCTCRRSQRRLEIAEMRFCLVQKHGLLVAGIKADY